MGTSAATVNSKGSSTTDGGCNNPSPNGATEDAEVAKTGDAIAHRPCADSTACLDEEEGLLHIVKRLEEAIEAMGGLLSEMGATKERRSDEDSGPMTYPQFVDKYGE